MLGKPSKKKKGSSSKSKSNRLIDSNRTINREKAEIIKEIIEKIALAIMIIGIGILLFVGPFQRGLFFTDELLYAKAFIFGLLVVWGIFRVSNKRNRLLKTPLDICLMVLLFAYFISFFVAVHKRDALEEVLKVASYLVVYLIVIDIGYYWYLLQQKKTHFKKQSETSDVIPTGVTNILHMLIATAAVVTIASLGAAAGIWEFPGAYFANRIGSPMGYPNAAAAYLMAAYLLTLSIIPVVKRNIRFLYTALSAIMLATIVLTFSRGAWLLLPPLLILLVVVSAPGNRLRTFLCIMVTAVAAIPMAFIADSLFRSDTPEQAWLTVLATVGISILLSILIELYFIQGRKFRIVLTFSFCMLVFVALLITLIIPVFSPVHLDLADDEPIKLQTVKQIIENAHPGTNYVLFLEVNAEQSRQPDISHPDYVWGVRVLGGVADYRDIELINYRGEATDGWELKEYNFQTGVDMTRLEVHIFNQYPGTTVTARAVQLKTDDSTQSLKFTLNRILPERAYDRLFSYSRDRNIDRRYELFRDALLIIRDYPVFGTGGGGWEALYLGYQQQYYASSEVHNHYLQVWIESGILGFLAFTGIWISFTIIFVRNCFSKGISTKTRHFWVAIFLPVVALGAHSAIDWNFSLAAVGFFLFVLLATGNSMNNIHWFNRGKSSLKTESSHSKCFGIAGIIVGTVLMLFTIQLINGLYNTQYAQDLIKSSNMKKAVAVLEKAIWQDPFRAENYYNLGIIVEERARVTRSTADLQNATNLVQRAHELEPFDWFYLNYYGEMLIKYLIDVDQGLKYIDRVMDLRPFDKYSYYNAIRARIWLAEYYKEVSMPSQVERIIDEVFRIDKIMGSKTGELMSSYDLGRIHYLLNNFPVAAEYFNEVDESDELFESAQRYLRLIEGEDE